MASKLTGDWNKVKLFADKFPKDLMQQVDKSRKTESEEVKDYLVSNILNQGFGHIPLKPETVKEKGSNRTLVDTGSLAKSYTVTELGDKSIIHPQGTHDNGLSMEELATIHEYGTQKIAPRPTIRPTYDKFKDELPKEVSKTVQTTINKYM